MKKIIIIFLSIVFTVSAMAQTMNVHFKNGTKVEFSSENVEYVDFTEKPSDPIITPGDYVDLGLSVKWATCNLGANTPYELGSKYAWGETSIKTTYDLINYAYYDASNAKYTDIGTNIEGTEFDAATVNLGKNWRMPTKTEMKELSQNCTWEWCKIEGKNGYRITGKNGNSIFMVAEGTGSYDHTLFWTSSARTDLNYSEAYYSFFSSTSTLCTDAEHSYKKCYGAYIRPIYSPTSTE